MAEPALILFREIHESDAGPPPHRALRLAPIQKEMIRPIGALYFESYDPGIACATLEAAVAETHDTFAGIYGRLVADASIAAFLGDRLVGCVMTVERGNWELAPDCPFVIELFVDRELRRHGIARHLMQSALAALSNSGYRFVALRAETRNTGAIDLYRQLGFSSAH